jgi:hypothetical protein
MLKRFLKRPVYPDIPDEGVALGDIISYITWHYRRSYRNTE